MATDPLATPLTVIRGDCLPVDVLYQINGANPASWSAGYTAELAATWAGPTNVEYDSDTDSNPVLGVNADSPAVAQITGLFPAAMTVTWPVGPKTVQYQMRVTSPDGCKRTLVYGPITVTEAPIEVAGG